MASLKQRVQHAQVRAAETLAVAGIPPALRSRLVAVQRDHASQGGCRACGSMIYAVHAVSCPTVAGDLY